jgi:hypothetical protein
MTKPIARDSIYREPGLPLAMLCAPKRDLIVLASFLI